MTGKAGEVKNGELWLRCPYCGDSQRDPRKAHYSVNRAGLFYCVRCHRGGRLPLSVYLRLLTEGPLRGMGDVVDDDWEALLDDLDPGPGSSRDSALDRFHIGDPAGGAIDVFLSRNIDGEIIGLALVGDGRKTVEGRKGLGFAGDEELTSSPADPIRVVEGPYDCLTARDVCVFGLPSAKLMRKLRGHFVILCPDGDVWPDYTKRKTIINALADKRGPVYVGVEMLKDGEDPDDVPYEDRRRVDAHRLVARWRESRRRARWEKVFE